MQAHLVWLSSVLLGLLLLCQALDSAALLVHSTNTACLILFVDNYTFCFGLMLILIISKTGWKDNSKWIHCNRLLIYISICVCVCVCRGQRLRGECLQWGQRLWERRSLLQTNWRCRYIYNLYLFWCHSLLSVADTRYCKAFCSCRTVMHLLCPDICNINRRETSGTTQYVLLHLLS